MTFIDKAQGISEHGRTEIEAWMQSVKQEDETGTSVTVRDYLAACYEDDAVTGSMLWNLMADKKALKRALLCEQGFVCCYCGRRLLNDHNTLIEHLMPKGGNNADKRRVFDYDNLMACCMGSTKHIIHLVRGNTESATSVAEEHGVTEEHIETLYIEDENYALVKREYDIENLQVGDRVLIIRRAETSAHYHCGPAKDDAILDVHPLQEDCAERFVYQLKSGQGAALVPLDEADEDVVESLQLLGLNNNPELNRERRAAIDKARILRDFILRSDSPRVLLMNQLAKYSFAHAQSLPYSASNEEFRRTPFWFVEQAVFTDRVLLSASS